MCYGGDRSIPIGDRTVGPRLVNTDACRIKSFLSDPPLFFDIIMTNWTCISLVIIPARSFLISFSVSVMDVSFYVENNFKKHCNWRRAYAPKATALFDSKWRQSQPLQGTKV